jgi:hypothetical protein
VTALAIVELERVERRVLGAVRIVDATTGTRIDDGLVLTPPADARLQRNRSGLFVITHMEALAAHESAFGAPPATPALGSVALALRIDDTLGRYLPRLARVALPRDPTPADVLPANSLFVPVALGLYPSAAARTGANWATLRVTATETSTGDALGGALLIVSVGGVVVARGLSDWRGEALVAVPGVPVTTWSDAPGAVVVNEVDASVTLVVDAVAGTRASAAQVHAGKAPATLPCVDPDDIEARRATLHAVSKATKLATGRSQSLSLTLALP